MISRTFSAPQSGVSLGNVSTSIVGTVAMQVTASDWTGASVTLKARIFGSAATPTTIMYKRRTDDVSASAPITADLLFEFNAAGMEFLVDVNPASGGTVTIEYVPLVG